jgi:hypothetical protein
MSIDTGKTNPKTSVPIWFWIISILALLWYLMDMSAFYMRVFMTDEVIKSMPENQQHLYQNMPQWVNIVFAAEVFGGVLGSLGLLLRKKWALPLFYISILGVLSQTFYIYFLSDAISTIGLPAIMMPLVAIGIGFVMILHTRSSIAKAWLM